MSSAQSVRVAGDLIDNEAQVVVTQTASYALEEVFDDQGELRLWEDSCGWNGLLREHGTYYEVNKRHEDPEWVRKRPVDADYVLTAIASHIQDPKAGGPGNFIKRCTPP